jgi:hypothetical protein
MRRVFLGPLRYWLLWLGILAALYGMGQLRLHVHEFNLFTIVLLAVVVAGYFLVVWTYRPGTRVTRVPFEDE